MNAPSIRLTIASRLENVPLIGAALRDLCRAAKLPREDCRAIELCVSEAVVNSIEHAYERSPAHEVTVTVRDEGHRLAIVVRDTGRPMAADMLARKRREGYAFDPGHIDRIPTSGRGLALIQSYMDSVTYHAAAGGNDLVMTKKKPHAGE